MKTRFWGKNKKNVLVIAYMAIMPLLCSSLITTWAFENTSWFEQLSVLGWCVLSVISVLTMGLAMTPTTFLAILFGYFLGIKAILFLLPAYVLASTVGYYVGLKIDGGKFLATFDSSNKAQDVLEGLKKNEFMIIIMSRMSPVLPFAVMNVVLSLGGADLKKFILGGAAGMLPRTLLSIVLGSQSKDMLSAFTSSGGISDTQIIVIVLFALSTLGMFYAGKKAFNYVKTPA